MSWLNGTIEPDNYQDEQEGPGQSVEAGMSWQDKKKDAIRG